MEPISDPAYWADRLRRAPAGSAHHAVFRCTNERWVQIEAKHREILAAIIGPDDSVLDAGCAWGRLLDLMPTGWRGSYLGVDLCPEFIRLAYERHPWQEFVIGDLRDLSHIHTSEFAWAVLISIRPMVRRNLGDAEWGKMEAELRRVARRRLYLEYDPADPGSIE